MKSCICCGTKSDADAQTCANCGEGSWSYLPVVIDHWEQAPIIAIEDASPTVPENFSPPMAIVDPDTAVEVPARRRRNR
jgi:hypothetical protein